MVAHLNLFRSSVRLTFIGGCYLLLSSGCISYKKPSQLLLSKESYCNPPQFNAGSTAVISANADSVLTANHQLLTKYSMRCILTMHALSVLNAVKERNGLQTDTSVNGKVKLLESKQHIDSRIILANSEITAIAAELDCEGERVDQVARYLDDINARHNNKLTVASIAISSIAGIAGALIKNSDWNKGIAIGGGATGLGMGLATLNPKGRKVELLHQRNLLRVIWQEKNDNDIPPFLWFMLTESHMSNSGKISLIGSIKQRWISYQFDGNREMAKTSVNFSDGGSYTAEDLHARAAMLNQLQAEVRSISQILNIYLQEFSQ